MPSEIRLPGVWAHLALSEMDLLGDEKTVSSRWPPGTSLGNWRGPELSLQL